MVGHGGSSAGSYLADPTSPIPSHCASIVATSTLRVKEWEWKKSWSMIVFPHWQVIFLFQELEQQSKKLHFDIAIKALSILRYIIDHLTQ